MNCIIVDDEPVARKGMKSLIEQVPQLELAGSFNNAVAASAFMSGHTVDLIFLDIQMPGITGMESLWWTPKQAREHFIKKIMDFGAEKVFKRYLRTGI